MRFRRWLAQVFYYYNLTVLVLCFFLAISALFFIYDGSSGSQHFGGQIDESLKSSAFWVFALLIYQLVAALLVIAFRRQYAGIATWLFVLLSVLIFVFLVFPTLSLLIAATIDIGHVF